MAKPGPDMEQDLIADARRQFFDECEEHVTALERGLLDLQNGRQDWETINTLFRVAHSLKGGAATFGARVLVRLAHGLESALAPFRATHSFPSSEEVRTLLLATDVVADLARAERHGVPVEDDRIDFFLQQFQIMAVGAPASQNASLTEPAGVLDDFVPVAATVEDLLPSDDAWTIIFRPYTELFAGANDPSFFLRSLCALGDAQVMLDTSAVPTLDALDPAEAHLYWTIRLRTRQGEGAIREIFEHAAGVCELTISPQRGDPEPSAMPVPVPAEGVSRPPSLKALASSPTLRVDVARLDRLINLVSELVIGEATLAEFAPKDALQTSPNFAKAIDDLSQLTRDIQESVMAIRAQPVRALFQRMPRLVREIEAQTGKSVELVLEGEDTEVDRTVIEGLTDPLTHMVRNSIDHGVESREARLAAGKPPQGRLRLSAAHRAGRVLIEVADDGGGIDRERVRALAVRRGLIDADAQPNDEALDNIIFEPGFSTNEFVTDLSGRGVGMDVVKRAIQALGGRISCSSRAGLGTQFALSLPLTLAVLDGMLVAAAEQVLVIPVAALVETVQLSAENMWCLGPNTSLLAIHGHHIPLFDLAHLLSFRDGSCLSESGVALLVEDDSGQRLALAVDDILGQRQVVIKSLDIDNHPVEGIAAATILGNGRVALILDINAVIASRRARPGASIRQAAHA
jgi:two-component system chemotaxis sensor kinase CheA